MKPLMNEILYAELRHNPSKVIRSAEKCQLRGIKVLNPISTDGSTEMNSSTLQEQMSERTHVVQQRVLVVPLVFEELVQPVGLEDALRFVGEEDGVAVERHPQLGL